MYYINLDNQPTTNIILLLNHCLNLDSIAGVSRSATIAAAYIMSVTSMNWRESLRAIKCARSVTNPNYGFQRQLQDFYNRDVNNVRKKPVFCFLRWKPCLLCLVEQSCTGGGGVLPCSLGGGVTLGSRSPTLCQTKFCKFVTLYQSKNAQLFLTSIFCARSR